LRKTNRIMKRYLFCVFCILSVLFAVSCSKSASEDVEMSDTAVQTLLPGENIYEMIGRLHNEGLDYVFDRYFGRGATKASSVKSKDEFIDDVISSGVVNDFLKSKGMSEELNPITKAQVQHVEVSLAALAEERDCQYYSEMESLLRDSECLEDFQRSVNEFIERVSSDESLDADNKEALLTGSYVLSASAEYWSENLDKWREALSSEGKETEPMTKGQSYALRVVHKTGQGIMEARVHPEGQDMVQTTTGGYIYSYPFYTGQNLMILHDGYKPLSVNYSGPGMNIWLETDNSGVWVSVSLCVLADGMGALTGCLGGPGCAIGSALFDSLAAGYGVIVD